MYTYVDDGWVVVRAKAPHMFSISTTQKLGDESEIKPI